MKHLPFSKRSIRSIILLTLCTVSCVSVSACEDPNKMFEGVWRSTTEAYDDLDGAMVGAPTLAIGHYGQDLTGLVYYKAALNASAYTETCQCALIEQSSTRQPIDFVERRINFTSLCHEYTQAEPEDSEVVSLDWTLTMGDEPELMDRTLVGTVRRSDGEKGEVTVQFKRVSLLVAEADKQCPPE